MMKVKTLLTLTTYLCVGLGLLSVISHVELPYLIAFAGLLLLSIYRDTQRPSFQMSRWSLNLLSILILAAAIFQISPDYLIEPILHAILLLTALKLLEEKKARDYLQIQAMCLFLLLGSSLVSLGMSFLAYLALLLVLSILSLMLLAHFSSDPDMAISKPHRLKMAQCAVLIAGGSLLAGLLFFVILPRTSNPVLMLFGKQEIASAGFSDRVLLGSISEIQENAQVVFRAEMDRVDEPHLYWRGVVLDAFDGLMWKSHTDGHEAWTPMSQGEDIAQTIYLEPYRSRYLFALDRPVSVSLRHSVYQGALHFGLSTSLHERTRYHAVSRLSRFVSTASSNVDRERYLQLPPDFSPEIRALVTQLQQDTGNGSVIQRLLDFMAQGGYRYSLKELPVSETPLEDFLLRSKQGNCEYFASALAVMLRMSGIPARLVGGYRGGYYNAAGGYYLVLQEHAHVWVEAYTEGGWLRLDPTPALLEGPSAAYGKSLALRFKLLMDTFNYYWYKLVITYDLNRQWMMLSKARSALSGINSIKAPELDKLGKSLVLLLPIIVLPAAVYLIMRRRRTPEQKVIARFFKKMSRHGYDKSKSEGLEEFTARIDQAELRETAQRFVREFQTLYYRDRVFSRQEVARLKQYLREG